MKLESTMHTLKLSLCVALLSLLALPWSAQAKPKPVTPTTQPAGHAAPAHTQTPAPVPAKEDQANAPMVGWIELSGSLPDAPPPFAWVSPENAKPSLRRVLAQLKKVASDKHYTGLVIYLDEPELDLAQIDELTQGIQEVRAAKKKVLVFGEDYDLKGYLLACAADQILLLRKGQLELTGLGVEEMYLAGLLEKVGAKADFLQVGDYKGAEEPLTRVGPSPKWSQNMDSLLDDLYKGVVDRIAKARGLDAAAVEKAFADCWTMSDEEFVKRKLVDRLTDRDMIDATEAVYGADFEWDDLLAPSGESRPFDNPFALLKLLAQETKTRTKRPSIAVITASGPITSGGSGRSSAGGLFGGDSIGSRTFEEVLADAKDDEMVKGVILRIDSPGGSALASEVIWQSLRACGEEKPVYVSIGSMAASGGYYLASAGHEIYVSPSTIVGSIGVVGGKIVLGGLYEKVGISVFRRARGPMGDMFNSVEAFTPPQKAALQSAFQRTYEQFTDRVKIGRGNRIKDISAVAQGRLFTGRQAVANGLADRIGGIDEAIADMAKDLKLKPGSYDVIELPPPLSLPEYLEHLFGEFAAAPGASGGTPDQAALSLAKTLLGPRTWASARAALSGMMLLQREPVLTLMPAVIVVR